MTTKKYIFYLAACLMLLVNTPSKVYAYANDWFRDSTNFYAYYDGMGSVHFYLLAWSEGGTRNHWAWNEVDTTYKNVDKWHSFVEYSTDGKPNNDKSKKWNKLFYYNGDNVVNKAQGKGQAWFWAGDSAKSHFFFTIPEKNSIERQLNTEIDSVRISHDNDERRSISFNLRWAVPTDWEGKPLSLRVHIYGKTLIPGWYDNVWYDLLRNEKIEKGEYAPELQDPILFMGGDNPEEAGKIMVPYFIADEPIKITTSLDPNKEIPNPSRIGIIEIPSRDSLIHNFKINALMRKLSGEEIPRSSNLINIPAYHTIKEFKVEPKMDMIKQDADVYCLMNSGYKILSWKIDSPKDSDAMSMDFFEIERAYKSDFSDAEQIGGVSYDSRDAEGKYKYVDESTINNPYGGDSIFYRIRRMSASSYGWTGHPYAASYTYIGRVKQMGLNLYDEKQKYTPYAAFRDCATDPATNNSEIDLSGQLIWPIADSTLTTAWDPNTSIEVVLWDEQEEAKIIVIDKEELYPTVYKNQLIIEFGCASQLPNPCQDYDLSVRLNTDITRFDKPQATEVWFYPKRRTSAVNMTSVDVSDGDELHPERTLITWQADGKPTYYTVWRRDTLLAGSDAKFDSIALCDNQTNWYNDTEGEPGKHYTYMVKAITLCGDNMETSASATGSRSRYGYVEGCISYTNGNKMAGIEVKLRDKATGKILQTDTTDADGTYTFSHIQYDLDGSTYEVLISSNGQHFHPAKGGDNAEVRLTASNPAVHQVDFLSDSYQRCSGRVLYTGTTIPVRDAYFLISGQVAKSSGDTIRTDASGNFVLSVPAGINFTLTVAKHKHTFVNDGKLILYGKDTLNFQSGSLDNVRFWDNTRVRLIGRLAGGDIQGQKPLGFGLSKNNLGDSLKLVFELEGDNIAHFVYDENNLSKTTRDTTFAYAIGKDSLRTRVRFEEKRIIVRPDSKTGEYVIDLPPVKYRIVEASANGYATLFSAGRTSETKDMTFSLDTLKSTYDGRMTWYHDTYSVIYHAPASVKVMQLRHGMPIEYYGEAAVNGYTMAATRIDSVYKYNPKSKRREYVFGYPVYLSGLRYGFRLYACEEYHYNNDINRPLDVVSLGGHKFTVYNGLLSGTSIVKGQLNNEGYCNVTVDVANVSYDAIGDAALKHIDVSVNVNGQDVHAEPIKAFVLGGRITGSDAMTKIGSVITVDDVLRDPPGSHSYAWIEKGATYNSSYSMNNGFDVGLSVTTTQGSSLTTFTGDVTPKKGAGVIEGQIEFNNVPITSHSSVKTWPIVSFTQSLSWNQTYNYSYTTSERIQTGNNNNIMGADATIFIGHTVNAYAMHSEVVTAVDTATLSKMKPSIDAGATKIVMRNDTMGYALIVTQDLAFTMDTCPVQFVYTQDHIVNQVIPQLAAEMSSLLRTGTQTSMQELANATDTVVYWLKDGLLDSLKCVEPERWKILKKKPIYVNQVAEYAKLINRWGEILYENEWREVYGTTKMNRVGSYSVSANTTVTHSEAGSAGYNYSFSRNEAPDLSGLKELPDLIRLWVNSYKNKGKQDKNEAYDIDGFFGTSWKLDIKPNVDFRGTQTSGNNQSRNRTIGFTLSQAEYGYIDVDVYSLAGTVDFNTDSPMKNWRENATNYLTVDSLLTGNYSCSDFIYLLRGGATRCPWLGENKTKFFRPGTLLDPATVKLDEAHLEVDKHEVSGVAANGVAVFDVQIWNEGEAPEGVANGPHNFNLKLIEGSNPNGAKASMDGQAFTGAGRNFYLSPGQIIHKKLEIRQGATALNYDSLKLCLISDCDTSNYAEQYISVHFLPASTPVHIATPDDKWVMNTNSPYDKQGYYLPVIIDGFDPDYANFDHIELQYKLSTQSESNWVTLCSYYVDEKYYNKASGNKQMFNKSAGRIDNIHFYGERDPMEQRYDLRAVSYCRYGTGYVTRASEPVSGIKDTRRPELFGNVAPANGVLTQQDYISVPFSEPIAYNYLDEDNNFQVVGFKNKADYFSTPTLAFSGNSDSYARTLTVRDLSHGDFSVDLIVYQENMNGDVVYFSTGNNLSGIEFGRKGGLLYARIGSTDVVAKEAAIPADGFARVVMTYNAQTNDVNLFVGTKLVGSGKAYLTAFTATQLSFGVGIYDLHPFTGRMAEARIWSKALTLGEITSTNNTCLTGYESGLLAYYPMTEGYGKTAYDKAHGANADLHNLTWSMPEGRALKVNDSKGVKLDAGWFNNSADADYTLLFSFRSDPSKPLSGDALLFGDVNAKTDATNKQIGIFMTQAGQIVLVSDSTNRLVADGNYNDGAWHSLGLVVSHGFNYTHLYLDNKLKAHADGQFFDKWAMSDTRLGKDFYGCFDELSIWELAMPQSYLSEFVTRAPNGQEFGLRCYLPFDQRKLNTGSIYETHYSPYNARLYYNRDKQEWYAKLDTVVRSELDDQSTTKDVCPLIRNSEYEKMRFSWTSRDNDLVINLKMPDAEINHKTIFFSLRDVEDLQGNRLLSPIAWSVYLDRNVIRWAEQNLWVEKSAGAMDTVVYTTITNTSGEAKPFYITGLPEWLTVDEPIGMLQPQEERVLAFTVSGDLNAGDYIVPVSVTDEAGLSAQMLINVRINAVFPNWEVSDELNLNMNLIGTVHLQDEAHGTYVDTDTRDVVGAFYGNTCVGMQTITSKVGSTANLYLKIYGDTAMQKKDISLRLWQASTGKTFVLQPDSLNSVIRFVPDTVYGSVQQPIDFYVADFRVQNIPIYKGWNWISFYVRPDNINSSFVTNGGFSSGNEIKAYSAQDNASVYTSNSWRNNIKLDYRNIYMLKVTSNMVLEVRGTATPAGQTPALTFRGGWNNLPCLFEANTPLDAAMSDYFNAAKDGDVITGYYQFAVFDNKQWVGSLETLIPGEGYMFYRQAQDPVTVHFYPADPATSAPRRDVGVEGEYGSSTVMPIVAALEDNEATMYPDDAVLRAYVHGHLAGEAKAVDGVWFLLVHAEDGSELTFTVTDEKGEEQPAANLLNYGAFTPTGTVHNPYLIRFGESELRKVIDKGILYIHRNGHVYDAQGTFVK